MEEKRLECLMMLEIHRSDTPSIDARVNAEACLVIWPNAQMPGWGKLVNVALLPLMMGRA